MCYFCLPGRLTLFASFTTLGFYHCGLVHTDQVSAMGCLPLPLKTDYKQSSEGLKRALDLGDDATVQRCDQADQESHAIPGRLRGIDA